MQCLFKPRWRDPVSYSYTSSLATLVLNLFDTIMHRVNQYRRVPSIDRLARYRSELSLEDCTMLNTESKRLREGTAEQRELWKMFGPYLSERQWATVREDYSENSDSWGSFPHDHARSRAYRWGEDGLLGLSDSQALICMSLALWNGQDPMLKERLFGVTGPEGNHGEDVKELYYYLDSTPTHSYVRGLYKYPHARFPYEQLVEGARSRSKTETEYELLDTGVFDGNHYWDVEVQYAKFAPEDVLMRITLTNRSPDRHAKLHVLPQLWFRNTWSWGMAHDAYQPAEGGPDKPQLRAEPPSGSGSDSVQRVRVRHDHFDSEFVWLAAGGTLGSGDGRDNENNGSISPPELWFTDNETNKMRLYGKDRNATPYVKDAFHRKLVNGEHGAVNPERIGTKAAAMYKVDLPPGGSAVLRLRLRADGSTNGSQPETGNLMNPRLFDAIVQQRAAECDEFYDALELHKLSDEQRLVLRQAYAGLLWSKQFFYYVVDDWFKGDSHGSKPPACRADRGRRNADWRHVYASDILSMPDKWEYPWFAVWDTAFHMIPMSSIDPDFAKDQLRLFLDERYMHPSGQIPAYEFDFGDVNPPVHSIAVWHAYRTSRVGKQRDFTFLKSCFHKLLLNFTWWVNRKDRFGNNIFGGGFLGLDNIGVFDRSNKVPGGGVLEQADGTSWMALFSTLMLDIALELAAHDSVYEEMAGKFFEHLVLITDAINNGTTSLWDDKEGFYFDALVTPNGERIPIKLRSLVGLVPLFACLTIERDVLKRLPTFRQKVSWFLQNRTDMAENLAFMPPGGTSGVAMSTDAFDKIFREGDGDGAEPVLDAHFLLAIPRKDQLRRMLEHMLDERKFLSPFGIRSMSREYDKHPFRFRDQAGTEHEVHYLPAESDSYMFGGNSNWRGPIWLPMNYLIVIALERLHYFHGDSFKMDFPTGSGRALNLHEVAVELCRRLQRLFVADTGKGNQRACHGRDAARYAGIESWRDLVLFYEYFDPETGRGVGASHQTGWTALITEIISRVAEADDIPNGFHKA